MNKNTAGHILIIDDEINVREMLARVLQRAGFFVESAADGVEALDLIDKGTYHLVYLDIRLPKMDGLEVLKEIRLSRPNLPVILLTAHASLQSALDAIRLGAKDYLVKPLDPEVFVAQTRMIMEEQIVEQRKKAIQEQITSLQAELYALETKHVPPQEVGRETQFDNADRFLKRGRFILDLRAQRATFGERVLDLPPTAFRYLSVLARRSPEVVSYQELVAETQEYTLTRSEASELAKYHIHVLRQAMDAINLQQEQSIINVRGVGYRLITHTKTDANSS